MFRPLRLRGRSCGVMGFTVLRVRVPCRSPAAERHTSTALTLSRQPGALHPPQTMLCCAWYGAQTRLLSTWTTTAILLSRQFVSLTVFVDGVVDHDKHRSKHRADLNSRKLREPFRYVLRRRPSAFEASTCSLLMNACSQVKLNHHISWSSRNSHHSCRPALCGLLRLPLPMQVL